MIKAYDLLLELEVIGTEQNRKVYRRHGVKGYQFGVSFANLNRLAKRIGSNTQLAEMLWCSGVHDARVLATMVADASTISEDLIDRWLEDLDNYILTDAFSNMVGRSKFAVKKAGEWSDSTQEWVGAAGWNLVARIALHDQTLDDDYFLAKLENIEIHIHERPNRTRYSMNNALIAIGVRTPALEQVALAVSDHIGKVQVDHGDTSCKTPDARVYILKTVQHRNQQRKKKGKAPSKEGLVL
jgi:3-methyladenine DNA glycosylase AlkD